MKIIFLDHDGVLCLAQQWGGRRKKQAEWNRLNPDNCVYYEYESYKMDIEYRFDDFDDKAIKILNQILKETDAEIVVSSDWRLECSLEQMQEFYKKSGIIKLPIGYTPQLESEDIKSFKIPPGYEEERAAEIKKWLSNNEVGSWVAIDDLNMQPYLNKFVRTIRMNEGIKQSGIKQKVIRYLNV